METGPVTVQTILDLLYRKSARSLRNGFIPQHVGFLDEEHNPYFLYQQRDFVEKHFTMYAWVCQHTPDFDHRIYGDRVVIYLKPNDLIRWRLRWYSP